MASGTRPIASVPALVEILSPFGLAPEVSDDPDEAFAGLGPAAPQLVAANMLAFTMTPSRYDEHRDRWGLSLSPSARSATVDWVHGGGRLLALHTALVSFDDWPGWADLIGGSWNWERSSHGPVGAVTVDPEAGEPFELIDECYLDLDLCADSHVVAAASTRGGDPQPACWVRTVGEGRVATSVLGHDRRSLDHPRHRDLISSLVAWLLEEGTT